MSTASLEFFPCHAACDFFDVNGGEPAGVVFVYGLGEWQVSDRRYLSEESMKELTTDATEPENTPTTIPAGLDKLELHAA